MIYHKLKNYKPVNYKDVRIVVLQCPFCNQVGEFHSIGDDIMGYLNNDVSFYLGSRICPNLTCKSHVYLIEEYVNLRKSIVGTIPPRVIPFDSKNVPQNIKNVFEEALRCYAYDCFVAAAIMIRKTLEEICEEKKSTGNNLYKRVENLKGIVVLPNELIEGMHELRLLGNDAAHIEANAFEKIGKEELGVSIEFTKEIIKAVYQYENILEKLRKLKKQKSDGSL